MFSFFYFLPFTALESCSSMPCENGAVCFEASNNNGFFCQCPTGFTGTNCENGKMWYKDYCWHVVFVVFIPYSNPLTN